MEFNKTVITKDDCRQIVEQLKKIVDSPFEIHKGRNPSTDDWRGSRKYLKAEVVYGLSDQYYEKNKIKILINIAVFHQEGFIEGDAVYISSDGTTMIFEHHIGNGQTYAAKFRKTVLSEDEYKLIELTVKNEEREWIEEDAEEKELRAQAEKEFWDSYVPPETGAREEWAKKYDVECKKERMELARAVVDVEKLKDELTMDILKKVLKDNPSPFASAYKQVLAKFIEAKGGSISNDKNEALFLLMLTPQELLKQALDIGIVQLTV
ncbi:MAG: hypothetical protein ACM3UU_10860 [Ignavibacteriales bacterium]